MAKVRVDLLQHLVDVAGPALLSLALTLGLAGAGQLAAFLTGALFAFFGHLWCLLSTFRCYCVSLANLEVDSTIVRYNWLASGRSYLYESETDHR